jgi:hypothetical protein
MPEATSNVEFASKIHEEAQHEEPPSSRRSMWVAIIEAVLLAMVAVATAWSGYQAAKWGAQSDRNYSLASRTTVMSQQKATLAGQDRLYDIVTFNGWVAAKTAQNERLTVFYQHRFRPEYAAAFVAWQGRDPFHNLSAPPGPIFMPEYTNANEQESARLAEQANEYFEKGVKTRETGDEYVKVTVFLATVLLLTAISQRFAIFGPRVGVVAVALALLAVSTFWIFTLPRA